MLDARGKPLYEAGNTWARVTTFEYCPNCGDDILATRAWETSWMECPACLKMFSVKSPRILKRVK
ncbi:hypothetical protein EP7_004294 [Isosphaeraceae bacterium EP7]